MKTSTFLFLILFLNLALSPGLSLAAGTAKFTITPPDVAFDPELNADPAATIDEYRVTCTNDKGEITSFSMPGYSPPPLTKTDMPTGQTTCYAVSFSAFYGTESDRSPEKGKMIYDDNLKPNGPALFDLTLLSVPKSGLTPGKYPFRADVAGITYAGDCNLKVKKHFDLKCKGKPL